MELDVRVSMDMERDRLRTIDKNAARKIVSNAENNLMHLLRSKEAVSCLKSKDSIHPFHMYQSRNLQMRSSLFD